MLSPKEPRYFREAFGSGHEFICWEILLHEFSDSLKVWIDGENGLHARTPMVGFKCATSHVMYRR